MSKSDWESYKRGRTLRGAPERSWRESVAPKSIPTTKAGIAQYTDQGGSSVVAHQMYESGMADFTYTDQGDPDVKIHPDKVKGNAAHFVEDARRTDVAEAADYYQESASASGRPITRRQATNKLNREKEVEARAILLAADAGKVKLTETQRDYLEQARDGKYAAVTGNQLGKRTTGVSTGKGRDLRLDTMAKRRELAENTMSYEQTRDWGKGSYTMRDIDNWAEVAA